MKRSSWGVILSLLIAVTACTSGGSSDKSSGSGSGQTADPLYSLSLMRQGSFLLQQGQFAEALGRFEEADRVAPGNATTYNMMGLCHLRLGQYEAGVQSFNTALELIPSFTDARNNRGAAYLSMGQYQLAEVDFLAVLSDSTYPHRWQVYFNLGMTQLQRSQLGAAEENFFKAMTANSPVYEAFLRYAQVVEMQNRTDVAVDVLEEARLKFPERPEASLQLGRLLLDHGRGEEARPYLEEVIAANPSSSGAREARALLGAL